MFFVLSGFVLTLSFFRRSNPDSLIKGMFKRYVRLLIPIMGICPLYLLQSKLNFNISYDVNKTPKVFLLDMFVGIFNGN